MVGSGRASAPDTLIYIKAPGFVGVEDLAMETTARLPENMPTSTNSIIIFVVLCLFVFGGMGFAKFMQQRKQRKLVNGPGLPPPGK
jgi:hypothetical protein